MRTFEDLCSSISEQYKVLTCPGRVNISPPWHLSTAWICYSLLARAMHSNRTQRDKEFIAGYDFSLVSPLNRNQCYLESRGVTEENTSTLPSKYIPILYSWWDERVNVLNISQCWFVVPPKPQQKAVSVLSDSHSWSITFHFVGNLHHTSILNAERRGGKQSCKKHIWFVYWRLILGPHTCIEQHLQPCFCFPFWGRFH